MQAILQRLLQKQVQEFAILCVSRLVQQWIFIIWKAKLIDAMQGPGSFWQMLLHVMCVCVWCYVQVTRHVNGTAMEVYSARGGGFSFHLPMPLIVSQLPPSRVPVSGTPGTLTVEVAGSEKNPWQLCLRAHKNGFWIQKECQHPLSAYVGQVIDKMALSFEGDLTLTIAAPPAAASGGGAAAGTKKRKRGAGAVAAAAEAEPASAAAATDLQQPQRGKKRKQRGGNAGADADADAAAKKPRRVAEAVQHTIPPGSIPEVSEWPCMLSEGCTCGSG